MKAVQYKSPARPVDSESRNQFVDRFAEEMAQRLKSYRGGVIHINCYTSHDDTGERQTGSIDLRLQQVGIDDVRIEFAFGVTSPQSSDLGLDIWKKTGWQSVPDDIVTASFDDAWRIVRLTCRHVGFGDISVHFTRVASNLRTGTHNPSKCRCFIPPNQYSGS